MTTEEFFNLSIEERKIIYPTLSLNEKEHILCELYLAYNLLKIAISCLKRLK